MLKKGLLVLVLACVLAGGVFAQDNSGLDFTSTKPQFFSFDLGAGIGLALDDDLDSQGVGAGVFGFKVMVLDDMEVGVDVLSQIGTHNNAGPAFAGLRIGYRFTPVLGAAIGIGAAQVRDATIRLAGSEAGISLGIFYDLFANRSKNGIATALKVRVDYVAETPDVVKGALFFSPVFTIGL